MKKEEIEEIFEEKEMTKDKDWGVFFELAMEEFRKISFPYFSSGIVWKQRKNDLENESKLSLPVSDYPWKALFCSSSNDDASYVYLRLNDFPDEPMYTFCDQNGVALFTFDDIPKKTKWIFKE